MLVESREVQTPDRVKGAMLFVSALLVKASLDGDSKQVQEALDASANIEITDSGGLTPCLRP